jgi:HEAT repeat protein
MTGIGRADVVGRSILDAIPGLRDRAPIIARFEQTLKEGTIEILAPSFHQFLIPCPPLFHSQHFAEMRQQTRIAPLLDDDTICGLIVTVEDVTQRMEKEIDLATALRSADSSVRLEAARALSESDDPLAGDIAKPVIDGLDDSDWKVRRKLVESMARRGGADAIEALLRAMRDKHMNFGVVNGALQILRASAIDTSAQLVEFLRSSDTDLRMHSALALGEQRDPGVVPHLISALGDEDANVRYHVVEALGKLRAAPALDDLMEIAEARDFFMSFAALDAIAEIGESRAADRIIELLRDEGLQDAALSTLGRIGRPSDVKVIVALLDWDESSTVAVADAAVALLQRHQGNPEDSETVLSGARDNISDNGRARVADALANTDTNDLQSVIPFAGWFPDGSISEQLCILIKRPELREKALSSLLMQGEIAVDPLVQCLASENDEVRGYAARALGTLGSVRAVEPLMDLVENGSAEDVQAAIDALGSIDDPRSATLLADLLSDPDPNIREHAVRSLGRLANKDFTDDILSRAKDADEMVRQAAIEQVALIAGHSGLPILLESLEGDTPRVRAAAARALAQLKHEDSIAPLRKALDDPDAWTRYFAVRGIGALRDLSSAERLRDISEKDPAQQVRMAAREVASELGT